MTKSNGQPHSYHRGRAKLIKAMGGECEECGEDDPGELQFAHLPGTRTWPARKSNRWTRLARYRREWGLGKVRLLCADCNRREARNSVTTGREAGVEEDWEEVTNAADDNGEVPF